jgi:thioredoxin 1
MLNSLAPSRVTMPFTREFAAQEPARSAVNALRGDVLLEFGAPWCPHCQVAQGPLEAVLRTQPQLQHLKIEDARGRPLGRSFHVKLWPTLLLMRDGAEIARSVRPTTTAEIATLLAH